MSLRLARTLLSCSIVALALALIAAAPASAQTPRPGQLGVAAGGGLHELTAEELAAELDVARDAGARWLRFDVNWDVVQAGGPDSWAWEPFDRIVEGARARGLKVLGTIWYTPAWARPQDTPVHRPPTEPADYGRFAAAVAERYGPLGVHHWEIWNEPNIPHAWAGGVSAKEYGLLLRAAATAIRAVDPQARIVSGGLSPAATGGGSFTPPEFLRRLYRHGFRRDFDILGHHASMFPYSPLRKRSWSPWRQMAWTKPSLRALMQRRGDARKRIWITEYGAPTGGDRAVSEARQALLLTDAYRLWAGYRWAGPLFWFATRDRGAESWHTRCGLVREDFSPKQSFIEYRALAGAALRR